MFILGRSLYGQVLLQFKHSVVDLLVHFTGVRQEPSLQLFQLSLDLLLQLLQLLG